MSRADHESELTAVVSGSFKFKPEIDELGEEFQDHSVIVIAPDTGWLYLPRFRLILPGDRDFGFRPLPNERHMSSPSEVEATFLRDLTQADFVYFYTSEGYAGNSVALEFGYALGIGKPMYALEPMDAERALPDARDFCVLFNEHATVLPVADVADDFRERFGAPEDRG